MKLDSLKIIETILSNHLEEAKKEYHKYLSKLENKYKTDWLGGIITKEESTALDILGSEKEKLQQAYNDFLNQEW